MNEDLAFALSLADSADEVSLRFFQSKELSVRAKADRSPVSAADEAVEQLLRLRIQQERPGEVVMGEEFGSDGNASKRWIIDPIDGTGNFIRGVAVYATLIALEEEGEVVCGVVSAPAMGRRWSALRGEGAYGNGRRIRVSSVSDLSQAFLGYDSIHDFPDSERFLRLLRACGRTRGFGDFWSHMLVAEGSLDIAIEPRVAYWDMAAVQVIVEEAGGRFTSLGGERRADAGSALSTNGRLHDTVLATMRQQ